jgi:hypothetical protein
MDELGVLTGFHQEFRVLEILFLDRVTARHASIPVVQVGLLAGTADIVCDPRLRDTEPVGYGLDTHFRRGRLTAGSSGAARSSGNVSPIFCRVSLISLSDFAARSPRPARGRFTGRLAYFIVQSSLRECKSTEFCSVSAILVKRTK